LTVNTKEQILICEFGKELPVDHELFTWSEGNRLVRELGSEEHLAARITSERKARKWTQAELASEMTKEGCPLAPTAISKIETPQPGGRRGITVDEAFAFAKVFDIPFAELFLPVDRVLSFSAMRLLSAAEAAVNAKSYAENQHRLAENQYREIVNDVGIAAFKDGALMAALTEQRRSLEADGGSKTKLGAQRPDGWKAFLGDVFEVIDHLHDRAPRQARKRRSG
jgi:transcriptional regulator with XRE-family HTH domain